MRRSVTRFLLFLALLAVAAVEARAAEPVTAVVHGAPALHLRRGPGTEHPAFATLLKGTEVQVEGVIGSWVRVRTTSGETGYVHSYFLEYPPGTQLAELEPIERTEQEDDTPVTGSEEPTAPAEPAPTAEVEAEAEREKQLEAEAASLREPLAAPPPTGPGQTSETERTPANLKADLERLLDLTEKLHEELAVQPEAKARRDPAFSFTEPPGVGPALALAGAGLLLGFMLGTFYGRRQERNRRTRVRF